MTAKKENELNHEEFFKVGILRLRDISKSRGIHSVYSGFNQAFREYFDEDPIETTQILTKENKIEIRPVRGGVMIYLPGDAPGQRVDAGKKALSKILNKPPEQDTGGLTDEVVREIAPEGPRRFPDDFLEGLNGDEVDEIDVPGTPLEIDSHSSRIVTSPRRHFRYRAKNPPEAKYIMYAHRIGERSIEIPRSNKVIFKAITEYEKYCKEMRDKCFALFLRRTNDEEIAELLTKEAGQRLNLRGMEG